MESLIELLRWGSVFLLVLCVTGDKIHNVHNSSRNEKGFTRRKGKSENRNRQTFH